MHDCEYNCKRANIVYQSIVWYGSIIFFDRLPLKNRAAAYLRYVRESKKNNYIFIPIGQNIFLLARNSFFKKTSNFSLALIDVNVVSFDQKKWQAKRVVGYQLASDW